MPPSKKVRDPLRRLGKWTDDEDNILLAGINKIGPNNWDQIALELPTRSGKQCRERYHNHLQPHLKKGEWTQDEDNVIYSMQKCIGNQWSKIASALPGRTDNSVKNRWHVLRRHENMESRANSPAFRVSSPTENWVENEEQANPDRDMFSDNMRITDCNDSYLSDSDCSVSSSSTWSSTSRGSRGSFASTHDEVYGSCFKSNTSFDDNNGETFGHLISDAELAHFAAALLLSSDSSDENDKHYNHDSMFSTADNSMFETADDSMFDTAGDSMFSEPNLVKMNFMSSTFTNQGMLKLGESTFRLGGCANHAIFKLENCDDQTFMDEDCMLYNHHLPKQSPTVYQHSTSDNSYYDNSPKNITGMSNIELS